MAGKVERDLRGKSGVLTGDGEDRNRPSPNPSRKRKGSKTGGDVGSRNANPLMPGLRIREDGWTAARARRFLAVLAQSGCVTDAARVAAIGRGSWRERGCEYGEISVVAVALNKK